MADGSVVFEADLNTDGLKSSLQGVEKSASSWSKNIGKFFSFSAVSAGLIKLAKVGVEYNIEMEKYATNFGVMLGSETAAIEHVAELREMAAKTPFGMEELANASQTMLSFGLGAEESMVAMQQLGDISLGNKERFNSLSLAFAQVSSAGKLTGQDLLQMVNAGFNPLQTIAEKTGTNLGDLKEVMAGGKGSKEFRKQMKAAQKEVKKMGENASEGAKWLAQIGKEGAISAEMVGKAMEAETVEGGRFYNGMEKASQTISGLWSTLQDETAALAGNILEPVTNTLGKGVLKAANTVVGALNSLFDDDGVKLEVSAEIATAQANLTTLDTDIQNLKNKYITETIAINIKADEANTLLARLAELQSIDKEFLTEADKKEMATISTELAAINPELEKFIGKDGIIRKDVESIQELTTEYLELAKAQATASYVADVQARTEEAKIQFGVAEQQLDILRKQRDELGLTADEWGDYQYQIALAQQGINLSAARGEDTTYFFQKGNAVIGQLVKDAEVLSMLSGKFDLGDIFNLEDMTIKSPEEIAQNAEAFKTYFAVLTELSGYAADQKGADNDLAAAIDAQITEMETTVAAAKETFEAEKAELDALMLYLETETSEEKTKTGTNDAAKTKGKSMAAAVGEGYAEGEDALAAEIDAVNQRVLKKVGEKRSRIDKGGAGQEGAEAGVSGLGKAVIDELSTGIEEGAATISADITGVLTTAKSSADTSQFKNVGYQITSGMAAGVRSGSGLLSAAVIAVVNNALAAAQRAAQIHSPSRLFRDEVGAMIAAGTAEGVTMGAGQLRTAVANMVNTSIPDMSRVGTQIMSASAGRNASAAMAAAMGAANFNQTNNFNVPVQTPDEFAKTMRLYATYGLQG